MKHDYSWRCQCDAEGSALTIEDAREKVKDHLEKNQNVGEHQFAFINEQRLENNSKDK